MVLFFSTTGNSQYVAEQIAKKTNDEVVSLNQLIKKNQQNELISNDKPFVFVCPTYAWRLPRIIEKFIKNTVFKGTQKVYFVLTYGGETASASKYVKTLCKYKGWDLQGYAQVIMPDNYVVLFPGIDKEKAKEINVKAEPLINQIALEIQNENRLAYTDENGFSSQLKSGLINSIFYRFLVKAKGFHVNEEACVSCGKCVELCPLNNIRLTGGKPIWGNQCTHCMACLHRCPTEAIEYKNKTQGKPRYFFNNK